MMKASTIFLCRHGERMDVVGLSWPEMMEEPWDPPLSPLGRTQMCRAIKEIDHEEVAVIVTSPMRRTLESADIASRILGISYQIDSGLAEWQNPAWFPRLSLGNAERPPRMLNWSRNQVTSVAPTYPETESQAKTRCAKAALAWLLNLTKNVLFIGHENGMVGIADLLFQDPVTVLGYAQVLRFVVPQDPNVVTMLLKSND